jgi:hypothetical protein
MAKSAATCEDCYFRKAGLCALLLERPCPTFREQAKDGFTSPLQAQLVARPSPVQATQAA